MDPRRPTRASRRNSRQCRGSSSTSMTTYRARWGRARAARRRLQRNRGHEIIGRTEGTPFRSARLHGGWRCRWYAVEADCRCWIADERPSPAPRQQLGPGLVRRGGTALRGTAARHRPSRSRTPAGRRSPRKAVLGERGHTLRRWMYHWCVETAFASALRKVRGIQGSDAENSWNVRACLSSTRSGGPHRCH